MTQGHEFYLGIKEGYSELNSVCIRFGGFPDVRTCRDDSSEKHLEATRRNKNQSDQTSALQPL
jgi:hypothetical protein